MKKITDKNLRDKMIKEKTLELKKAIEQKKQNTYEEKNKNNTIHKALTTTKEKQPIKEEPIQMKETFCATPKTKITGTRSCRFWKTTPIGAHYKNVRQRSRIVTTVEKKGHYPRVCRQRQNNNRRVKQLTEEPEDGPNESISESD